MFCDLIFLIQRVGSKDIQTHTQTRRAEKRALLKSKIFNLENDKEPLDFPIPGKTKQRQKCPTVAQGTILAFRFAMDWLQEPHRI